MKHTVSCPVVGCKYAVTVAGRDLEAARERVETHIDGQHPDYQEPTA
ncbi:MAG: hypothetical protein JWO98_5296 [Frankiales bacterium]|nr:hypothetical protein [Frankiales bacterium]